MVGATGNRKRVAPFTAASRSAVSNRKGMPTCSLARLEPGNRATHWPGGKGESPWADSDRSAIRSPTTVQRLPQRAASRLAAAGPMAAMRSFQRGQRATHSA